MTNKEVIAELKALGVEFNPKSPAAELAKLLSKTREDQDAANQPPPAPAEDPTAPAADPTAADETKAEKPAKADKSIKGFDVLKANVYIRTFSPEVHGEDFEQLANDLIGKEAYAKRGYRLVPSNQVTEIIVTYREKADYELPAKSQKPDAEIIDKAVAFEAKASDKYPAQFKERAIAFANIKKGAPTVKNV